MSIYYNRDIQGVRDGDDYNYKANVEFNTPDNRKTLRRILDAELHELIVSQQTPLVLIKLPTIGYATTVNGIHLMFINIDLLEFVLENYGLDEVRYLLGEILVHEYVHIQQLRCGRLVVDNSEGKIYWEGVERKLPCVLTEKEEYFNTPWEKEAYRASMEYALAKGRVNSLEEARQNLLEQMTN